MRTELEQIEKTERYIKGEMTAAERAAFEETMVNNPSLREEVILQQEIQSGNFLQIKRYVLSEQKNRVYCRTEWCSTYHMEWRKKMAPAVS